MTNWCKNLVTISNDDQKVIEKIENAFHRNKLFDAFIPCPTELEELTSLKPNDALVRKMVAKHGAEDWYLWRLDHWGTKWDTKSKPRHPKSSRTNEDQTRRQNGMDPANTGV